MLVDLVWLNKASIPNISFLGGLEDAKHYFPWGLEVPLLIWEVPPLIWWVGVITRIKANLSSAELG